MISEFCIKYCRRSFSTSTFKTTYRQKRPDLNEPLSAALIEGMSIRPSARAHKVSKTTVLRKLKQLGQLAKQVSREKLESGAIKTSYVQYHLWIFMAPHNGWLLPNRKIKSARKNEVKAPPTPEVVSISLPSLDAPKISVSVTDRNILIVPASFMREHGLLQTTHYRANIDPVSKIISLTFHDEAIAGAIPFRVTHYTGYLSLGFYLRRNEVKLMPGRVTIQWDEMQQCVFIAMGELLAKE